MTGRMGSRDPRQPARKMPRKEERSKFRTSGMRLLHIGLSLNSLRLPPMKLSSRAVLGSLAFLSLSSGFAQTLTEVFQPGFVASGQISANRIQTVGRYTLAGLKPNATYRYISGFGKNASQKGAGGFWAINNASNADGYIVGYCGTGEKSLDSSALAGDENANRSRYGEFKTDAKGEYTGWFASEGTGNAARFTPGTETRFVLGINDGEGGTEPLFLLGERPVRALGQEAGIVENNGTLIVGDTKGTVPPETIVLLYNDVKGGELIWGTWVENIGIDPPTGGPNSPYAAHVSDGRWAAYVPHDVSGGIRRVEYYSPEGKLLGAATSSTGVWKPLDGPAFAKAAGNSEFHGGVTDVIGIEAPVKP